MYRHHSFEEKLNIVTKIQHGIPLGRLACEYNLDRKMVREWLRKYELYGESGLQKQGNVKATYEIKREAALLFLDKGLPLSDIALRYGVSRAQLRKWIKLYSNGVLSQSVYRGRPLKDMGRSKKKEPVSELDKLQAENARLKAELALLKKVRALVEERETRERMSGRKPSKY